MASTSSSSSSWTTHAVSLHAASSSTPHAALIASRAPRQYDSVDEEFGYPLATLATHESRHNRSTVDLDEDSLPEYVEKDESLPIYSATYEPETLSMYLFKFGFLFPPFWIFGAFILLSPLREPPTSEGFPAWMPEKTEAERRDIIEKMRVVEVKWSKRCLYALIVAATFAIIAAVAVWAVVVKNS